MKAAGSKGPFRNYSVSERAARLRGASLAFTGVWTFNFLLFFSGFSLAFSTGARVTPDQRDQPRVIVNKGVYRQLETPAYVYIRSHEIVTLLLTVIALPSAAYLEYVRFTTERKGEGVGRGMI